MYEPKIVMKVNYQEEIEKFLRLDDEEAIFINLNADDPLVKRFLFKYWEAAEGKYSLEIAAPILATELVEIRARIADLKIVEGDIFKIKYGRTRV